MPKITNFPGDIAGAMRNWEPIRFLLQQIVTIIKFGKHLKTII